jgi:hypothetical protein
MEMEKNLYFKKPTQVWFMDVDENEVYYNTGIAYHDEIICGCFGDIYGIREIWEAADKEGLTNPIIPMSWVDLSDEISGDMPCPIPIFTIAEDEFEDIDFKALSAEIFKDK